MSVGFKYKCNLRKLFAAFYSHTEAKIMIQEWRRHYNTMRPHSSLGYGPAAPESIIPLQQRPAMR